MPTKKTSKKTSANAVATQFVIVGHGTYGLKYGTITEPIATILARGTVVLRDGGNVFRYDTTPAQGGPSTLAALGPNGGANNRIGKANAELGVTEVRTVYVCTPEAVAQFAPYTK